MRFNPPGLGAPTGPWLEVVDKDQDTCSICLEKLEVGDQAWFLEVFKTGNSGDRIILPQPYELMSIAKWVAREGISPATRQIVTPNDKFDLLTEANNELKKLNKPLYEVSSRATPVRNGSVPNLLRNINAGPGPPAGAGGGDRLRRQRTLARPQAPQRPNIERQRLNDMTRARWRLLELEEDQQAKYGQALRARDTFMRQEWAPHYQDAAPVGREYHAKHYEKMRREEAAIRAWAMLGILELEVTASEWMVRTWQFDREAAFAREENLTLPEAVVANLESQADRMAASPGESAGSFSQTIQNMRDSEQWRRQIIVDAIKRYAERHPGAMEVQNSGDTFGDDEFFSS